jgi:hypothetical protein
LLDACNAIKLNTPFFSLKSRGDVGITEKEGVSKSQKLFTGLVLTIIGLLGLGYGPMGMGGGMMGMRGYGYYSPFAFVIFLGVMLFGLYIIYTALRD